MANRSSENSNIYSKNFQQKIVNMSSRQQVLFLLEKTMKEADWDMDNQINEESKDLADFVPKNENEEFEAFRKTQVISISYFLFREEKNSILILKDTET